MAYCTDADLKTLLEGTQYLRQGNEMDFAQQIAWADAWADAELEAAGVETPLSNPPAYLRLAVANYCAYLITRRPSVNGDFDTYSESFRRDALELMGRFKAGAADIPGQNTLPKRWGGTPMAVNPDPRAVNPKP